MKVSQKKVAYCRLMKKPGITKNPSSRTVCCWRSTKDGCFKNWLKITPLKRRATQRLNLLNPPQGSLIKIFVSSDGSESDSDRNTCRERCIVPLIHRRRYRLCFHRC